MALAPTTPMCVQGRRPPEAPDYRGHPPEVIRLSEVVKKCRRHFDCLLAHTGQNYDYTLNGIFFRDLS